MKYLLTPMHIIEAEQKRLEYYIFNTWIHTLPSKTEEEWATSNEITARRAFMHTMTISSKVVELTEEQIKNL